MSRLKKILNKHNTYDYAVQGLGLSGVELFINLVPDLIKDIEDKKIDPKAPIRMIFINDDIEIGGKAYSPNTSPMPQVLHQSVFVFNANAKKWLDENNTPDNRRVLAYIEGLGGKRAEKWLKNHKENFENHNYGEMRLPRAVYGLYLSDQFHLHYHEFKKAFKNAEVDIVLCKGGLPKRWKSSDSFYFTLHDEMLPVSLGLSTREINGFEYPCFVKLKKYPHKKVYEEHGHTAPSKMPNPLHKNAERNPYYYGDIHKVGCNTSTVAQDLLKKYAEKNAGKTEDLEKVSVMIGGSSAAALDMLQEINENPELRDKVKIYIIAGTPGTRKPALVSDKTEPFIPANLPYNDYQTASELYGAFDKDYNQGIKDGYTHAEVARYIAPYLARKADNLPLEQKQEHFDRNHFHIIIDYLAFDCEHNVESYNSLERDGILTPLSGRIRDHDRVISLPSGEIEVTFMAGKKTKRERVEDEYMSNDDYTVETTIKGDVFINCMGNDVQKIMENNNLNAKVNKARGFIQNDMAVLNEKGLGLKVDENYQLINKDGKKGITASGLQTDGNVLNGLVVRRSGGAGQVEGQVKKAKNVSREAFCKKFPHPSGAKRAI